MEEFNAEELRWLEEQEALAREVDEFYDQLLD